MKKIILSLVLFCSISFMAKAYFMSQMGTASMEWLTPGSARISCAPSEMMCWGIGTEGGRNYIDVIGIGSWWMPSIVPTEDPAGSGIWNVDLDEAK